VVRDAEFAELFAGRARALRRTAFLLCGDWHRAEDLTQTAFAKLYAAWPRLRDPAAAEAYLRLTLTRTFLDDNRRGWRRERATETLPEQPTGGDATDDRIVLMAALAQVSPRQRACVVLRYFDDLSVEDVADALRCSTGTVKSNTARGLDTLRRLLADDDLVAPALIGGDTP
jgi:RNA polymerase sigma-70 factor (sigma-E family)